MTTHPSPGNATSILSPYTTGSYGSGITSGDLSTNGASYRRLNLGGTPRQSGLQLQRAPQTSPQSLPFKEPPQQLNLRRPLNLRQPLNLKPPPPTPQNGNGVSNALNQSLQAHRQRWANSGNRTSTSGPRGVSQAARNINAFGSLNKNVASNPGTAITGSARTNAAIEAFNRAKTGAAPQATNPGYRPNLAGKAAAVGAGATAPGWALGVPVANLPLGITAGAGALALGAGLYIGNKLYEGLGSPFGPSLGELLEDALDKDRQELDVANPGDFVEQSLASQFPGGQAAGVMYTVHVDRRSRANPEDNWNEGEVSATGVGPVNFEIRRLQDSTNNAISAVILFGDGSEYLAGGANSATSDHDPQLEILDVRYERLDGEPDELGEPLPVTAPASNWPPLSQLPSTAPDENLDSPVGYDAGQDFNQGVEEAVDPINPLSINPNTVPEVPGQNNVSDDPLDNSPPQSGPEILPNVDPINPTKTREESRRSVPPTTQEKLSDYQKQQNEGTAENKVPFFFGIPGLSPLDNPNKTGNTTPPETLKTNPPATTKSSNCGCNGGINAHTDQIGQQLSNKLDNIPGLSNIPDLANLGLLATILDLVNGISGAVGVASFPMTVPGTLNGKAATSKELNNLTDLHEWNARNLDSVMGRWPNTMSVEDGGDLEFDTVNDQLNELMGLMIATALQVGINQQGITKTLTETLGIKQESHLAHKYAQANSEYLGFRQNQRKVDIPSSFTPGANNITDFLNPKSMPMISMTNDDDQDLQGCLTTLCEAANIIIARYKRRIDRFNPAEDIRQQIQQVRDIQTDQLSVGNQKVVDDFAEFVRQVEDGWGLAEPYGRDNTDNPNIRTLQ